MSEKYKNATLIAKISQGQFFFKFIYTENKPKSRSLYKGSNQFEQLDIIIKLE
jgi:hypothetical protein